MNPFIAHMHEDIRIGRLVRRGATGSPRIDPGPAKAYPRMERLALPAPAALACGLCEALAGRRSSFGCPKEEPVSQTDLGTLLGHALGVRLDRMHRNYPSGGPCYPVETYLLIEKAEGVVPGAYHYHAPSHALERLAELPAGMAPHALVRSTPYGLALPILLIFTSIWERSSTEYGDFAYELALLEAGHMSENVLLVASAMGLESRPLAGFADRP